MESHSRVEDTTPPQGRGVSSLYLCYFGLREPLVQTQVLPYLRRLCRAGARVGVLTFEREDPAGWEPGAEGGWRTRLASEGIDWIWRRYHKRPQVLSTLYDIVVGSRAARAYLRKHGACILHARGHWAAAMAAPVARSLRAPFLFDIRGLAPEEYVDAGLWPAAGLRYRAAKWLERRLMASADGFIVLTHRASELLFATERDRDERGRPIQVIPCCVDMNRFAGAWTKDRRSLRSELGLGEERVFVYLGALGGWYLTGAMAEFLSCALAGDPSARFMLITQSDPRIMAEPLRRAGVADSRVRFFQLPPDEVPTYLRAADVGLSFIKPSYSKQASSPTKLAEYLAAGLPVVCNSGVGDVDSLLSTRKVGVLAPELNRNGYQRALTELDALMRQPGLPDHCRRVAEEEFDLDGVGALRYRRMYQALGAFQP